MYSRKLKSLNYGVSFFLLVLYCSSILSCRAQKNNQSLCAPSSCGNIGSISYPFRLKTDPKHCGKPGFELDCQKNQTFITFNSKSFHVESINYNNYTIRMTDPGIVQDSNFCSYPKYSLVYDEIPNDFETLNLNKLVVFVNCKNSVNSPEYISCGRNNSGSYVYITVRDYVMSKSDLGNSCSVDKVTLVSLTGPPLVANNVIRTSLAYGFELSWYKVLCDHVCGPAASSCTITDNQVTCTTRIRALEAVFPPGRLEHSWAYYMVGYALDILVLRWLIGICCLPVLICCGRKRLHSWKMRQNEHN